ncbi:glycosyltransferase [Ensifer canadensis]
MDIGIAVEGNERLGVNYEGIWRVLKYVTQGLLDRGNRIHFYCLARHSDEVAGFIDNYSSQGRPQLHVVSDPRLEQEEFENSLDQESGELLADLIMLAGPKNSVWLNPNPFWRATRYLPGFKVSMFHDFLIADFPISYINEDWAKLLSELEAASEGHDHFIVLSEYVKKRHAIETCKIPSEKLTVVTTPPITYDNNVLVRDKIVDCDRSALGHHLRTSLKITLGKWLGVRERELFFHHTANYPYEDAPYIFISTQNRPHKNLRLVAEAASILVRQRFNSIPVFTTALIDIKGQSDLEIYLAREHLFGDFASVGKLEDTAHAIMYKLAALTVHPSSFEGNFPLPFAESVSMGTPCIIPYSEVYKDFIPEADWKFVFYQNDASNLANKVELVCRHRDLFLKEQKRILKRLQLNTWDKCAAQYEAVFEGCASKKALQA